MSMIVAILVFGMIILIHEFGHFIVAKKCGIGVVEFSMRSEEHTSELQSH